MLQSDNIRNSLRENVHNAVWIYLTQNMEPMVEHREQFVQVRVS